MKFVRYRPLLLKYRTAEEVCLVLKDDQEIEYFTVFTTFFDGEDILSHVSTHRTGSEIKQALGLDTLTEIIEYLKRNNFQRVD